MEEPDWLLAPRSPVEPELGSRRGWVKSCHASVCGGEAAETGSRCHDTGLFHADAGAELQVRYPPVPRQTLSWS